MEEAVDLVVPKGTGDTINLKKRRGRGDWYRHSWVGRSGEDRGADFAFWPG